jgi:5-methylcytosine-specific restriction enzyme subunit McrC
MKIPIQNIYYLLVYAWDSLEEADLLQIEPEQSTDLLDLFANVLSSGVAHILRRGLDRGYLLHEEAIPGIRGKLQVSETAKRALRRSGRAFCVFDEQSYDISSNRIIKASLKKLLQAKELSETNRALVSEVYWRLHEISDIELSNEHFRLIQLHRNNAFYVFLLDVCSIIHNNLLPDDRSGDMVFRDFVRNEGDLAALFEQFVGNFLAREQNRYRVSSSQLKWNATGEAAALEFLPVMQTDIVLTSPDRKIVIDTKFYSEALQRSQFKETVRSGHLYQIYAYLRNIHVSSGMSLEGMLLYPTVERTIELKYVVDGYPISIRTVNLDQPWQNLRRDLLELVA